MSSSISSTYRSRRRTGAASFRLRRFLASHPVYMGLFYGAGWALEIADLFLL
ncbi:MAG: hypothetical protein ACJ0SL_05910 [Candidatus Rariloculaceae bacterium]